MNLDFLTIFCELDRDANLTGRLLYTKLCYSYVIVSVKLQARIYFWPKSLTLLIIKFY